MKKCLSCNIENENVVLWFGSVAFCADVRECHQRWLEQQTGVVKMSEVTLLELRSKEH